MNKIPLFPVSLMGSWPRSNEVLSAYHDYRNNKLNYDNFFEVVKKDTLNFIKLQDKLGIDIITDGEFYRDNYCSFVADRLDGVTLITLPEITKVVSNQEGFDNILDKRDVSKEGIRNAICNGKLKNPNGLVIDVFKFVRANTKKPIKVALPGPYLLTRSLWLKELSSIVYENKDEMSKDVLKILCEEIANLRLLGANIIQLDEPILSEVAYSQNDTVEETSCSVDSQGEEKKESRTFMCGALSERKGETEELEYASDLIKQVVGFINHCDLKSSVHMCRGNWSTNEISLLTGSYYKMNKTFEQFRAQQLTLEYSTPRAGRIACLFKSEKLQDSIELGLGVVNPRIPQIETVESIVERVEEVMRYIPKERIWLNTDCGFATFCDIPMNTATIAEAKVKVMVEAAKILRKKYA